MQSECQTECKQEWTTIELLQHKISTLEASLSSLAQLDASMLDDKLACLYTGFPTLNSFTAFVNYLEPKVRNIKRTKEFDVQGKQGRSQCFQDCCPFWFDRGLGWLLQMFVFVSNLVKELTIACLHLGFVSFQKNSGFFSPSPLVHKLINGCHVISRNIFQTLVSSLTVMK